MEESKAALPAISTIIPLVELRLACAITHTALDDDLRDEAYAAIDYVEDATNSILIRRAVTATFYPSEVIQLRGPQVSVTSVTVDGQAVAYTKTQKGLRTVLKLSQSQTEPVTVVYTAGPTTLPYLARSGIKAMVVDKRKIRGSITDGSIAEVPHGVTAMIRLLSRGGFIG